MPWPTAEAVRAAAQAWAEALALRRPEVRKVGLVGSLATGGWGFGSDVVLVLVVESADAPFVARAAAYDATPLPVPADVLVYTQAEWASRDAPAIGRFARDAVWLVDR